VLVPLWLLGFQPNPALFTVGAIYANFMEWYNHKVNFHSIPHLFAEGRVLGFLGWDSKRIYYMCVRSGRRCGYLSNSPARRMHGHHHKYPDANPVTPLPQVLFL
jgi:hypothetical protein